MRCHRKLFREPVRGFDSAVCNVSVRRLMLEFFGKGYGEYLQRVVLDQLEILFLVVIAITGRRCR
jgi:hypothetical protein